MRRYQLLVFGAILDASTVSALGAQNIGAGKPERAKLTLRYAIFITAGFGLIVAIIINLSQASGWSVHYR
ncbi:MAG: MATE family efflux transporter [Lachnospiraceae bacterium]